MTALISEWQRNVKHDLIKHALKPTHSATFLPQQNISVLQALWQIINWLICIVCICVWAERISLGTVFQFLHCSPSCDLAWTHSSLVGRITPEVQAWLFLLVISFWLEVMANIQTRAYIGELRPPFRVEPIWVPAHPLLSIWIILKLFLEQNNQLTIWIILLSTVLALRVRNLSEAEWQIVINWWLVRKNVSNLVGAEGKGKEVKKARQRDKQARLSIRTPLYCSYKLLLLLWHNCR